MSICLATLATPEIKNQVRLTLPNQMAFAVESGFAFHFHNEIIDKSRHPSWSKLLLVSRLLNWHEAVLLVDTDVVIRRNMVNLARLMLDLGKIAMFRQPRDGSMNAGICMFRRDKETLKILGQIYMAYPSAWDSFWWEQEAFVQHSWIEPSIAALDFKDRVNFEGGPKYENAVFYHAYGPGDKIKNLENALNEVN